MEIPAHFQEAKSTLHLTSFDPGDKNENILPTYMSDSDIEVYNFDVIQKWYAGALDRDDGKKDEASNDALYVGDNKVVFIEFKNGKLKKGGEKRRGLVLKIYNSHLILADSITETDKIIEGYKSDTKYSREHIDYILVYNEEKNPPSSKDTTRNMVLRKGKITIKARFGLAKFEGCLYRKVLTYTEREFKREFVDKISNGEDFTL